MAAEVPGKTRSTELSLFICRHSGLTKELTTLKKTENSAKLQLAPKTAYFKMVISSLHHCQYSDFIYSQLCKYCGQY